MTLRLRPEAEADIEGGAEIVRVVHGARRWQELL